MIRTEKLAKNKEIMTLQVSCDVAFTDIMVILETIALIAPRKIMPDKRSGVLFGQVDYLDRLDAQCIPRIPRNLLTAKGRGSIEEGTWGEDILFLMILRYGTQGDCHSRRMQEVDDRKAINVLEVQFHGIMSKISIIS